MTKMSPLQTVKPSDLESPELEVRQQAEEILAYNTRMLMGVSPTSPEKGHLAQSSFRAQPDSSKTDSSTPTA